MRTLLLLRGAPGCGKSTFIENNNLKEYTISSDDLRMMYGSPAYDHFGNIVIPQENDKAVWENLFRIKQLK